MPNNKLIILARYWNDKEWIEASLNHVDYWKADKIYIAEGNWDKKFQAISTDGTRETCEKWVKDRDNAFLIDNPRQFDNYRENQAFVSNKVVELSEASSGDWMLIIDCDHFYFKNDIDLFIKMMKEKDFIYPIINTFNFLKNIDEYYLRTDKNGSKLPYKIIRGMKWIPTNHMAVNGKMYSDINTLKCELMPFNAYHYAGMRLPERLKDKYNIGDRKSPDQWKGGIMLNNLKMYKGIHPEFAVPVLNSLGYIL